MASKAENCGTYCKFGKIGDLTSDHEHEKSEHLHDKGLRKINQMKRI